MRMDVEPALLFWRLACRQCLGLLTTREIQVAVGWLSRPEVILPEHVRTLALLDSPEHPGVLTRLPEILQALEITGPSTTEAAWALTLEAAIEIDSGSMAPRDGARHMVEVLFVAEKLGAPPGLLSELTRAHALMTMRDDANEVARSSSGERSKEFREYAAEYDGQIKAFAERLVRDAGLSGGSSLADVRAAAIARESQQSRGPLT